MRYQGAENAPAPVFQVTFAADTGVDRRLHAWSDLFNASYYNYAIASQFTPGVFNAYPLPGLNGSVALTYTFQ